MKKVIKNINHSKQRDAIIEFLKPRKDHPVADTIYKGVKKDFPSISLGTVYRNLTLLSDLGIIQKISCGDNSEHFDFNPSPHNHFVCQECNSIIDLEMDNIDFINTLATKKFSGKINGHTIYFYGTCYECMTDKNVI